MQREALATFTTLMLLAGCLAAPEDIETASAALDSPLLDSLYAFESSYTSADSAIVLRTNVTSEGGTAAFWWEIPEGVILGDEDETWIEFLAAPVLLEEERAPLERWMLMAFLADDGALSLNSLAFGAPFSVSFGDLTGAGDEEIERSLDPFLFGVGGKLRPGGRVGFVVSGVAAQDVELALVLLPLQKEWDEDEELPEDTEAFLALSASRPHVALPVVGTGGMHQLAFHYQGGSGFGQQTITSGPVEIDGGSSQTPLAQRRGMVVSAQFGSGGYAIAATGYMAQTGAGSWEAFADAHGAVSEASGPLVAALGPNVGGYPFVVAMGEGDTPSQTSLTLDTMTLLSDQLYLLQLDLDATLSELLGLPAVTVEGMDGDMRLERDGNDAVLRMGGVTVRGVGLA